MGEVETHSRRKGGGGAEGVCGDVLISFPGKVTEGILSSLQLSRGMLLVLPSSEKEKRARLAFQRHFHGRGSAGML